MFKHILAALWQWLPRFIFRLVMSLIGMVVVLFALPFRQNQRWHGEKKAPTLVPYQRLPRWAKWWDNPWDGVNGDDAYVTWQRPKWTAKSKYLSAYWWTAIRNRTNWLTRFTHLYGYHQSSVIAHEILSGKLDVFDSGKSEHFGHQFQYVQVGGKKYYGFYLVKPLGKKRMVSIRLGNKVRINHLKNPAVKYWSGWVGWTFRPLRIRTRPQFK